MRRIFAMYRLNPGVKYDDYVRWSKEVDQPITSSQDGVHSFEVFQIEGAHQGDPSFDIAEAILVDSWDGWLATHAGPGMKQVREEWPEYANEKSAVVIYGNKTE